MKLSARNQIPGTVTAIHQSAVNDIVVIDAGNGIHISATISVNAVKELELAVGSGVVAVIKATSVMFGVED